MTNKGPFFDKPRVRMIATGATGTVEEICDDGSVWVYVDELGEILLYKEWELERLNP